MTDPILKFFIGNLAAGAAILAVLALRKPARIAFGARLAYAMWLLVPLATLATLLPPRVIHVAVPALAPMSASPQMPVDMPSLAPVMMPISHQIATPAGPLIDPWLVGVIAWIVGVIAMAAWMTRRQMQFAADMRLGKAGPAVVGFLRPRIVTPADFETRFDQAERTVVLAHETIHLARNDARINALVALARCVAWFNPLVHVAAHCLRIDQELACDAAVVERHPKSRRLYADALLKTQLASRPLPVGCYWPARTEHPLTERIAMLKHKRPGRVRRMAGAGLLAALASAAGLAAWAAIPAREELFEEPAPEPAPQTPPTRNVQAKSPARPQHGALQPAPPTVGGGASPAPAPVDEFARQVYLRGKIEKLTFGDTSYNVFVRASTIVSGVNPGAEAQADATLWELPPTNFFGDRDAIRKDLIGRDVDVRGVQTAGTVCAPACHMMVATLAVWTPTAVPAPVTSTFDEFAHYYDTSAPVIIRGKVQRIAFGDRTFDAYITEAARGPIAGKTYQVRAEYRLPRSDIEKALAGQIVTVAGWKARSDAYSICGPVCGMYGSEFTRADGSRMTPNGGTLLSPPKTMAEYNPDAAPSIPPGYSSFMGDFDDASPVAVTGRIIRVTPNPDSGGDIAWIESASVEPSTTNGAKPGTQWRAVGLSTLRPDTAFIGKTATVRGFNAKNRDCKPTCSMRLMSVTIGNNVVYRQGEIYGAPVDGAPVDKPQPIILSPAPASPAIAPTRYEPPASNNAPSPQTQAAARLAPKPASAGFPPGGYTFARYFDANDPVLVKGVVTQVEFVAPYTQVYIEGSATGQGADPERTKVRVWRGDSGQPSNISGDMRAKLAVGAEVTARGYAAKDKNCTPNCRMAIRDLTFADGAKLLINDQRGSSLVPPQPPIELSAEIPPQISQVVMRNAVLHRAGEPELRSEQMTLNGDKVEPVKIRSDRIQIASDRKSFTYSGHVAIEWGADSATADEATVTFASPLP